MEKANLSKQDKRVNHECPRCGEFSLQYVSKALPVLLVILTCSTLAIFTAGLSFFLIPVALPFALKWKSKFTCKCGHKMSAEEFVAHKQNV